MLDGVGDMAPDVVAAPYGVSRCHWSQVAAVGDVEVLTSDVVGVVPVLDMVVDGASEQGAFLNWHSHCIACCGATPLGDPHMRGNFSGVTNLLSASAIAAGIGFATPVVAQEETIKVGVLHSLSGTMAISETTLKDTMLFLIDEQNKKGGLLGKKLEAVVVDPASDWPLFAEKARELIEVNRSPRCSAAGPRCRANPCCRSSRS